MIVAQQKRKENIVEYLLYMWQVEDMIRACNLDIDEIDRRVISQYEQPADIKAQIRRWYGDLIDMMRGEGIIEHGHLQINKNIVAQLTELHSQLLKNPRESVYDAIYYRTLPFIVQLRAKSGGEEISEIETCLTAVYGFVMLKMKGSEISQQTFEGVKQISSMLAFLAAKFHDNNSMC